MLAVTNAEAAAQATREAQAKANGPENSNYQETQGRNEESPLLQKKFFRARFASPKKYFRARRLRALYLRVLKTLIFRTRFASPKRTF